MFHAGEIMKFSLWLERKQKRNQKSEMKMPRKKSKEEMARRDAAQRIEQMAGRGNAKNHGKAGQSDSLKEKEATRHREKQNFNKQLKYGD